MVGGGATVSVVIPTHNCLQYLPYALESVKRQSFAALEVVVVDDASTDGTGDYISSLETSTGARSVRYLRNETRRERSYSRNRGVEEAHGRWIAFLDADDVWLAEHLQTLVDKGVEDKRVTLVFSLPRFVDRDGRNLEGAAKRGLPGVERKAPMRALLVGHAPMPSGMLVNKEAYLAAGGFREGRDPREDWDLGVRMGWGGAVAYVPELTFLYRAHTDDPTVTAKWLASTLVVGLDLASRASDRRSKALIIRGMARECLAGWRIGAEWVRKGRRLLARSLMLYPGQLREGEVMFLLSQASLPRRAMGVAARLRLQLSRSWRR